MAILATSQIKIVDISDSRELSAYLTSNTPKVQIENPNTLPKTYIPDWSSNNVVVSPSVFLNQNSIPLNSSGLVITWKRKDGVGSETNLISGESSSGGILTVNKNQLVTSSSGMITYVCYIQYLDTETNNTVSVSSDVSFSLVKNAEESKLATVNGEQVFRYDKNGNLVGLQQITLEGLVQGVNIVNWQYKNSSGSWVNYPTTSENANITTGRLVVTPSHNVFNNDVANIKLNTSDNYVYDVISITKLRDGADGASGQDGADGVNGSDGVGGLSVIIGNEAQIISAEANGNCSATTITIPITSYLGTNVTSCTLATPSPLPSGMTFSQSTNSTTKVITVTLTVGANATLGGVNQGIVPLTITCNGQTVTKAFSWSKSIKGANGQNGADGVDGANATSYWLVSSVSAIGKNISGVYNPSTVTFSSKSQTGTQSVIDYSGRFIISETTNGTTYTDKYISSVNEASKQYTPSANIKAVRCRLYLSGGTTTLLDEQSIPIVSDGLNGANGQDGANGDSAITGVISNESQSVPTDSNGNNGNFNGCTSTMSVYRGSVDDSSNWTYSIAPSTGVTQTPSNSNRTTTVTAMSVDVGYVDITATRSGFATIVKRFVITKNKQGVNGSNGTNGTNGTNGADGVSAVTFTIFAPNGTVVSNHQGTLTLQTQGYEGANIISSGATYLWQKYKSGSWSTEGTTASITVDGSSIENIATYKCTMTYKTKTYVDVITLEDKTDSLVGTILSTGGDKFRNGYGESHMICKLFANGVEVDVLKSNNIGDIAPTNPTNGTFWYKTNKTNKTVSLMKYNGSSWVTATETHENTYKWYRVDYNGNALDNGLMFKSGKIIYVTSDDVNINTTFKLEIE